MQQNQPKTVFHAGATATNLIGNYRAFSTQKRFISSKQRIDNYNGKSLLGIFQILRNKDE
jgi:hypothetical protein